MVKQLLKLALLTLCKFIENLDFVWASCNVIVLAQSGLKSIISSPGDPRYATYTANVYSQSISEVPSARWIWDGPGNTATCYMNITVEQTFILKCLGQPMTVYIAGDDSYTATILNVTGKGNNWKRSEIYVIPTIGIACNAKIKLTMFAANAPKSNAINCKSNPAGLIYAVTTNDCPCLTSQFYHNLTCLCQYCADYIPGCLSCDNETYCLACNASLHYQLQSGTCECVSPRIQMLGCLECVAPGDPCTNCDSNSNFALDAATGSCICKYGYIDDTNICKPCRYFISRCAACSSLTICTKCDPGYVILNQVCIEKCGDGLLRGAEECDDGNNIAGDGCSPICRIQPYFACDTTTQPSQCSYAKPLQINNFTVLKDPNRDAVTFTFMLGDNWRYFKNIDFSHIISSNSSLSNTTYELSEDGVLTMNFDLGQSLEGKDVQFSINPTLSNQAIFRGTPASFFRAGNLSSSNNVPIRTFSHETYETQQGFDIAYKTGLGLSYVVLIFGIITDKVIGVELFGAWQVAFFSLSTVLKVPPLLSPLMNLTSVNGVNSAFDFEKGAVPERVAAINYSAAFLANCNYTVLLVFVDVIIGLSLLGAATFMPVHRERLKGYGRRLLKEFFVMLVSFNSLNIGFSAGLEFAYSRSAAGIFCAALCLSLPIIAIVLLLTQDKTDFGEFVALFRSRDCTKERYFVAAILFRVAIGLLLSLYNEVEQVTIVAFFVGIFFTVYQWGSVPFKQAYHNYRTIVAQSAVMAGLFIGMYYRSMKSTTSIQVRTTVLLPAYLLVVLLFLCIGVSLAALVYEIYLKYKSYCLKKSVVTPAETEPAKPIMENNENRRELTLTNVMTFEDC